MEIIHVVLGKANPKRMNGVNRVVHELATHQTANGVNVWLWGITHNVKHDYPARTYRTRLFRAHRNGFLLDKSLCRALDGIGTDTIFHLHGGFIPSFYALARALQKRRIPYVVTAHGSYNVLAMERSSWRKKLYFRMCERRLLKGACAIHCLGKSEVTGLQGIYPNNKTLLIPYGYESPACLTLPVFRDRLIVGFCGRLDIHTKGLDLLLQAFARLLDRVPSAELWLIGDGPERSKLEAMALTLGIKEHITFHGSRFDKEKLELLGKLHVFAHPSRNEGLPTAVLEAASLGIPCVITEATNLGESIRRFQCGEAICGDGPMPLTEALLRVYYRITRGELALLSANARRMIREGYNWKKIVRDFHQLYQRA